MQEADVFAVEDPGYYEIVAFVRGEKTIYYDETVGACPDELGGWWLITKRQSSFAIYRGDVGCPYCGTDDFHNWFQPIEEPFTPEKVQSIEEPITRVKADEFVEAGGYEPVAEIPFDLMRQRLDERTIGALLPRELISTDNHWSEWPARDQAAEKISQAVSAEMGWLSPLHESIDEPSARAEPSSEMKTIHPAVAPLSQALRNFSIGVGLIAGLIAINLFIDLRWWIILPSVVFGIVGLVVLLVSLSMLLDVFKDQRGPVRSYGVARKIDRDFMYEIDTSNWQFVLADQTYSVDRSIWDWMNDGEHVSLLYWRRTGIVVSVNKFDP